MQISRRTGRKQFAVPPASSSTSLPDGWFDVYRWFCCGNSTAGAEELTAEVCRRLVRGGPAWLAGRDPGVRQRFFVAQVVLERRGVLPVRASATSSRSHGGGGRGGSAGGPPEN